MAPFYQVDAFTDRVELGGRAVTTIEGTIREPGY
jgi:hypothetical protein